MTGRDLAAYAAANWGRYLAPVTELSKEKEGGTPLVESGRQLYDFDSICLDLFPPGMCPASADALEITDKEIRLIEFKSGFRKRITRENFDEERARCEVTGQKCEKFWKEFEKARKLEKKELLTVLRSKAVESCLTLERKVFPFCPEAGRTFKLAFIVVADVDAVDGMVDTLGDLSGKRDETKTDLNRIRASLARYGGTKDGTYCYDRLEVLPAAQYASRLRQN